MKTQKGRMTVRKKEDLKAEKKTNKQYTLILSHFNPEWSRNPDLGFMSFHLPAANRANSRKYIANFMY